MGRTTQFDRKEAIKIGMHYLWRNGYEACSVKAIAEKLGITRSSFYNAFGNREAFFLEMLTLYATQTPDRVLNSVAPNTSIKCLLTSFFRDVCQNRTADPEARGCLAINCVAELVGVDETLGPVLENVILDSLQRFERLLECAASQGEIARDDQLYNKALALQNLLAGLSIMAKVIRSRQALESVVEHTLKGLELFDE